MKRKWIWGLAALPLIVGLVFAKALADKRPQLVLRGKNITALTISPDGKKALARDRNLESSWLIKLEEGQPYLIEGSADSVNCFSPDGKKIYQLVTKLFSDNPSVFHRALVVTDVYMNRKEGEFGFAPDATPYGVWWHDSEITVESASLTWRFEASSLKLKSTQKHNRPQRSATLCPDGQTIYWPVVSQTRNPKLSAWNFADLQSGKVLWSRPKNQTLAGFSVDGRTVLWSNGDANVGVMAHDTRTGREKWRLRGPQSDVLALSPDEKFVYEARQNGELWKWPR